MSELFPRMIPALAAVQLRRVGKLGCVMPVAVGASIAAVGAVLVAGMGARWATLLLLPLIPLYMLVVGLNAVAVLTGDPLAELQGSTPTSIRAVQTMRAILLALGGAVGGLVVFVPLHLMGVVYGDVGWASVVTPTGGAVVLVLTAYVLSVAISSPHSVTFSVVLLWVVLALFWDTNLISALALQRGVPLAVVIVLAFIAWFGLRNQERAMRKAVGMR